MCLDSAEPIALTGPLAAEPSWPGRGFSPALPELSAGAGGGTSAFVSLSLASSPAFTLAFSSSA